MVYHVCTSYLELHNQFLNQNIKPFTTLAVSLLFLWFDPFQNTVSKPSRNTLFYQLYFIDMVLSHSISFPLKIRYLQKFEKDLDN